MTERDSRPGPCRCHTYRSPGLQSAYRRGRAAGLFGDARRGPYADDATWAGTHRAAWIAGYDDAGGAGLPMEGE